MFCAAVQEHSSGSGDLFVRKPDFQRHRIIREKRKYDSQISIAGYDFAAQCQTCFFHRFFRTVSHAAADSLLTKSVKPASPYHSARLFSETHQLAGQTAAVRRVHIMKDCQMVPLVQFRLYFAFRPGNHDVLSHGGQTEFRGLRHKDNPGIFLYYFGISSRQSFKGCHPHVLKSSVFLHNILLYLL